MEEKEVISVAYAMNDKHAKLALISMISILDNTESNIEFLIAYSELSDKYVNLFKSLETRYNCKVLFAYMDKKEFDFLPIAKWVTIDEFMDMVDKKEIIPTIDFDRNDYEEALKARGFVPESSTIITKEVVF